MDYMKRGSHAWGVYPTHYTSRKSEPRGRNRHMSNSNRVVRNLEERNVGSKGKSPKQGLTRAEVLTIMLTSGSDLPLNRSN